MRLLISRHGNTFGPTDTPVWLGANKKQDLSLVDSGRRQANDLAQVIQELDLTLSAIYCGPLQRTREYAQIIGDKISFPVKPIVDFRLNEIDYGDWSGLTKVEIQAQGGGAELDAWENFSQWPKAAHWLGSPEKIIAEVKLFAEYLIKNYNADDNILVITSNGRLRYFLHLIPGAFARHVQCKNFKVATGNLCLLLYAGKKWLLKFWNKKPRELLKYAT
jgi:broad specificity phosphatase PhoE